MEDIFQDVRGRLEEFTSKILIDYERESLLLEIDKNYLDETMKILKNNWFDLDIVFQKELKEGILTIVACIPQIIDIIDE